MTIIAKGRVRGKGLTRRLAGSFPPASEKIGWMTPPVYTDRQRNAQGALDPEQEPPLFSC